MFVKSMCHKGDKRERDIECVHIRTLLARAGSRSDAALSPAVRDAAALRGAETPASVASASHGSFALAATAAVVSHRRIRVQCPCGGQRPVAMAMSLSPPIL